MITVRPDFYDRFKCRTALCRHSCCELWEIDVDAAAAEYYMGLEGELGDELRRSLSFKGGPHFELRGGRCPFLDADGLCRIIKELGEDSLCDICAEHPRFYNCFPGREELGLGLCCEEAAALLTGSDESLKLIVSDDGEKDETDEKAEALAALRDELFAILSDRDRDVFSRVDMALGLVGRPPFRFDPAYWNDRLLALERLDDSWGAMLSSLSGGADVASRFSEPRYERMLEYFIYRHLINAADMDEAGRVVEFCCLGAMLVCALDCCDGAEPDEHLRMFSAEIEYSDENIGRIISAL